MNYYTNHESNTSSEEKRWTQWKFEYAKAVNRWMRESATESSDKKSTGIGFDLKIVTTMNN